MDPMAVPEILSDMSDAEQMVIARLASTVHVHLLKHGGITSKGRCIVVKLDPFFSMKDILLWSLSSRKILFLLQL